MDQDGKQLGVMPTEKARQLAVDSGFDLVLIAPTATPPVCRIADLGKLRYEVIKKEKEARKSQKGAGVLKEVKLSVKIGEHDFQVMLKRAVAFLTKKNKVKVSLRFKGREVTHPELGLRVLERFVAQVGELGVLESPPKKEGKMYFLMLAPK